MVVNEYKLGYILRKSRKDTKFGLTASLRQFLPCLYWTLWLKHQWKKRKQYEQYKKYFLWYDWLITWFQFYNYSEAKSDINLTGSGTWQFWNLTKKWFAWAITAGWRKRIKSQQQWHIYSYKSLAAMCSFSDLEKWTKWMTESLQYM